MASENAPELGMGAGGPSGGGPADGGCRLQAKNGWVAETISPGGGCGSEGCVELCDVDFGSASVLGLALRALPLEHSARIS